MAVHARHKLGVGCERTADAWFLLAGHRWACRTASMSRVLAIMALTSADQAGSLAVNVLTIGKLTPLRSHSRGASTHFFRRFSWERSQSRAADGGSLPLIRVRRLQVVPVPVKRKDPGNRPFAMVQRSSSYSHDAGAGVALGTLPGLANATTPLRTSLL